MPDWRIRKRYGHGAARIVMCPEPCRGASVGVSFVGDMREAGLELFGGVRSAASFGLLILATIAFVSLRDHVDFSQTQMAVWRTPETVAKLDPPTPAPAPSPAKPVPVVQKKIAEKKIVEKKIPEKKIAKVEPKPAPIERVKPKPVPVKVAKIVEPVPIATPRLEAKIQPKARKPKITIAALANPEVPKAAAPVERQRTIAVESERRNQVSVAAAALNTPALPDSAPSPSRAQRVTSEATRRPAPLPVLAVAQNSLSLPDNTRNTAPERAAPAFARATSKSSRPDVQLVAASAPVVDLPSSESFAQRERPAAVVANTVASHRPRVDIGSAPAAIAAREVAPVTSLPTASRVTARSEIPSDRSRGNESELSLRGVSLGSLASCVSDREEDLLKQRVLAAVRSRGSCESSFGTYRFVETKNLNAFSMWIENAPGREASDRCVELTHALACLE